MITGSRWFSEMFDEEDYEDGGSPPLQSIAESEVYDPESAIEERGRGECHSPAQSVIEDSVFEEEEEDYDHGEGARLRHIGDLSTVQEDDEEREETQRGELDSASFVSGAQAINRINADEMVRRKKHEFIQNDPRFNNTFNPKENSWEPSPYQSRIEERGDESNRSVRGDTKGILPASLDTSKGNRSTSSKTVKFSEKTETRDVSPLTSSESCPTLVQSDERLTAAQSPIKNTQCDLPSSSRPSSTITGILASPTESNVSSASSVYVSTPNGQMSKQQHTRSLRHRFSDISAIEGEGKNSNSKGGFLPSSPPRDNRRVAPSPSAIRPSNQNETLSNSEIINIVQQSKGSENLLRDLENARNMPKRLRKPDFTRSIRSMTSSVAVTGGGEQRSVAPSRQSSLLAPLSSSTPTNTSYRPLATSFITNSSGTGRGDENRRQERLPDVTTSSSRREMAMRNESVVSSRRETSMRNEEYGRQERLPEIRMPSTRQSTERKEERLTSLPPRPPLRPTQRTMDEPRRRNESNTSTCSGVSSRSSQSDMERVDSRAESVTSSQRSGSDHIRVISSDQKDLDFGFVNVGDSRILAFKGKSALDFPVTCRLSLNSDTKPRSEQRNEPIFKILDGTEITMEARGDIVVRVLFTPQQEAKFMEKLTIQLSGGISQRFGIVINGSGGRAHLELTRRPGLNIHRSGDFVFTTDSNGPITFRLENNGKRSAYVRAVVVDGYGKKVEGVVFNPSNSLVIQTMKREPLKVDVSGAIMNDSGRSSSSLRFSSGMGIRRSSTTSINSVGSSASSRGRSAPSYTIRLYWGEETQRHRMIAFCRSQSYTSFPPLSQLDEDFSTPFVGEEKEGDRVIDPNRRLKKLDIEYFTSSMRLTSINVHLSSGISTVIDDDSDPDRTLMPDDTFRGNDTMVSMAPDLTVLRFRK